MSASLKKQISVLFALTLSTLSSLTLNRFELAIQERNYVTQMRTKLLLQLEKRIRHPKLELVRNLESKKASIRRKLEQIDQKQNKINECKKPFFVTVSRESED